MNSLEVVQSLAFAELDGCNGYRGMRCGWGR